MIRPYFELFLQERRILCFGVLMTFFSSFGQTFFISLFSKELEDEFGMGSAAYGTMYSLATLCSAACLPLLGRYVDHVDLRKYSIGVLLAMGAGCVCLGNAREVWQVVAVLFLLRLTGQGLCGHVANTTMARRFDVRRGKALGISALGFSFGEGIFPAVTIFLFSKIGWRMTCWLDAAVLAVVTIPLVAHLLAPPGLRKPPSQVAQTAEIPKGEKEWTRSHVLKDWRFYTLLPNHLFIPFAVTGLIFHQLELAGSKGWTMETLAMAFMGFAVARIGSSLVVGTWVDKVGARRLFPFVSVPICLGIGFLSTSDAKVMAWVYMGLMGASMGYASAVGAALWAEVYGVRHLGAIKSLATSLGIFGTALGPVLFGWVLEYGLGFPWVLGGTVASAFMAALVAFPVCFQSE